MNTARSLLAYNDSAKSNPNPYGDDQDAVKQARGWRCRELFDVMQDRSEKNNVAAQHPDKVVALQQRLRELAKQSEKPLFLVDQFKVITKGMHGEPILPKDADFAGVEEP